MNEEEKMYKNAKIDYEERYNDCTLNMEGECHLNIHCDLCNYSKEKYIYPPFTAEKQIKIMELLGEVHAFFDADKTSFACITNYRIEKGIIKGYEGKGESVSEALAGLINNLWQDLTDAEKAEIKNILESEVRE